MKKRVIEQSMFAASGGKELYDPLFRLLEHKNPTQYDRIMDSVYNETHIGGGWHRSFDGQHTLSGSYEAIQRETGSVEFAAYVKAHVNELVTPQGIPLLTLDHDSFFSVTDEIADNLGGIFTGGEIREYVVDLNGCNASEACGAALGSLFILSAFRSGDSRAISRVIASNLCLGLATGNPAQVFAGLAGLALGVADGRISSWNLLVGATPGIMGLGTKKLAMALNAGAGASLVVGIAASVGTAALIAHLEEHRQKAIKEELGNDPRYVAVMTPGILRMELSHLSRRKNTLAVHF